MPQKYEADRRQFIIGAVAALAGTGLTLPRPARAADLEKLNLVLGTSPPDPACHYLYYPREKGLYKANGVDVNITGVVSATNATRAVIAGEADIGWPDGVSSTQARARGARIKVISAFSRKLDYVIVGSKTIGDMKQLEGKRFASATIGGGTYVIPRGMCAKAGGDPSKVQFVALGNSAARATALIANTVDATIVTSSFVPKLLTYDHLRVIADAGKELPDFIYTWEIVSDATLQKRRGALESFAAAVGEGIRWANEHPDEAAEISVSLLPDADKNETRAAIKAYLGRRYWTSDGLLPQEALAFTEDLLFDADQIKTKPAYEDFVAADLMQATAARLAHS